MARTQFRPETFNIASERNLPDARRKCLPALHALTECDTTSKIATKLATLNAIRIPTNLPLVADFNCPQLTDNAIELAKKILVKCLKPSSPWKLLMSYASIHLTTMP